MLRRCSFAAIPYLLMIGSTTLNCSYADADKKNFLEFTKEKKRQNNFFLNLLESNHCCHFLITGVQIYKIALFTDLEIPSLRVVYGH